MVTGNIFSTVYFLGLNFLNLWNIKMGSDVGIMKKISL